MKEREVGIDGLQLEEMTHSLDSAKKSCRGTANYLQMVGQRAEALQRGTRWNEK